MINASRLWECIQMLCILRDSLVPCDYVGNDSTIIDGVKIDSSDFVLKTAIEIMSKIVPYTPPFTESLECEIVHHARWVNNIYCSNCNRFPVDVSVSISNQQLTKYFSRCPHCGARMDGGAEND